MSVISIPRTKELEVDIEKALVSPLKIAGIVAIQLAALYALIPVGVYVWRLLVCPSC
jgi:hypothetical protein